MSYEHEVGTRVEQTETKRFAPWDVSSPVMLITGYPNAQCIEASDMKSSWRCNMSLLHLGLLALLALGLQTVLDGPTRKIVC